MIITMQLMIITTQLLLLRHNRSAVRNFIFNRIRALTVHIFLRSTILLRMISPFATSFRRAHGIFLA